MPYRFKHSETFEKGLHRIGGEQVRKALKVLNDDIVSDKALVVDRKGRVFAVHESRKAIKRIRALLHLVRPALKDKDFRRENVRFRDLARQLSAARDHHVMLQTLSGLNNTNDAGVGLQTGLVVIHERLSADLHEQSLSRQTMRFDVTDIRQQLEEGRDALVDLQLKTDDFDAVGSGLAQSYRRGSKEFARGILAHPDDKALHEWRKLVQLQWRHMALLREAWPEMCAERLETARSLSQALGWHNDLSVLQTYTVAMSPDGLSHGDAQYVLDLIELEKKQALEKARPLAARLFAERPKALKRSFAVYWYASAG